MLNTLQEIQKNGFVNRFTEIASDFGLYGTYVNWQPGGINGGGVFFVCGLDKDKILSRDIDMRQILNNQRKNGGLVRTDVVAFKLSGQHPFMAHYRIVNYFQKVETIRKSYEHFNKPIPVEMPNDLIETMEMTWNNFANKDKPLALRMEYENMLKYTIETSARMDDKNDPEYKKNHFKNEGYYDTGRGKLYNWYKKHFVKHKNEVSLPHLLSCSKEIGTASILYKNYGSIKQALDARPDILYNFSKVQGMVLDVADTEGFGSKENNDRRYYRLSFDSVYTKDIEEIIQSHDYPEEFNRTIEEIDPHGIGVEHIIVPTHYVDMLRDFCKEDGVKFCIDRTAIATVGGGTPIAFCVTDSAKMYANLKGIADSSEHYHLKPLAENKQQTKEFSIDREIERLKNMGYEQINPQSADFEFSER